MYKYTNAPLFFLLLILLTVAGCSQEPADPQQPAETNTDSDAPEGTFVSAVTEVISLRNTIRDGFAAGDIDAAHDPLHEVGFRLEDIPELAKKAQLDSAQQGEVDTAVEKLLDAFGNVDKTLHGGEGSTYEEEAEAIDAAVLELAKLAGVEAESEVQQNNQPTDAADNSPPVVDVIDVQDTPTPAEAVPVKPADAPPQ